MKTATPLPALFLSVAAALGAACADPTDDDGGDELFVGDTETVLADGKSDGELRARVTGMTVWIDPAAYPATRDGREVWVLEGRASRDLDHVFGFVPDDPFTRTEVISARRFEIIFEAHELSTMLSGLPLFVRVAPKSGEPAFAGLWLQPSFAGFQGSSKLWLSSAIAPVSVGGEVVYRGRAKAESPYTDLQAWTDDDSGPAVILEATRRWRLDWSFDRLARAAAPAGARVFLRATRPSTGAFVDKSATVRFGVAQLGLTRLDPYEVWASECDAEVRACLVALPAGTVDTEGCGSYREVQRCGGLPVAAPPSGAALVSAMQGGLVGWYADHGADVAASGGNGLEAAQALVTAAGFTRVTEPDEDPHAHDLSAYFVYRHADVVWPGSDIAWFVVFERATGAFVDFYDFN